MKYLYKQTGVVVESSVPLDSTIFTPVMDESKEAQKPEEKKEPVEAREKKTTTTKNSTTQKKPARRKKEVK